ncbi:helix-turn-helix domain-containing protein [uncultured Winogradskyella sp.]|uniref:helix-turn-helix domain-containing protein n=1 Tax=uncultured Winogradskyella sp. TaxID=395353 RepID=UPI003514C039
MGTINLIAIDQEEFKASLIEGIKSEIKQATPTLKDELLTREQTAEVLKISLTTLWNWTKKNKIQSYGIGNKVYYKKSEIMNQLVKLNQTS